MCLLLRVFAFILLTLESFEFSSKVFTSYLKDKLLAGYYRQENITSRAGCVYSCAVDDLCFGMAYHKSRRMCYFYDTFPRCVTPVIDVGIETILPKDSFIENIALNKPNSMSSTYTTGYGCKAVDGLSNHLLAHTKSSDLEWWCVDLEKIYTFQSIVVYNRKEGHEGSINRMKGFELRLSYTGQCNFETYHGTTLCYKDNKPTALDIYNISSCYQTGASFSSRFIFISPRSGQVLNFREIIVFGHSA